MTKRWPWWLLLASTVLCQAVVSVIRPTISYRALELGTSAAWLGVLAASYALVPLGVAVQAGRSIDRRGHRWALLLGVLALAASAAGLVISSAALPALLLWSAVLGLGHILVALASQTLTSVTWSASQAARAFGYYAFAASLGQLIGSSALAILGGDATLPDTRRLFLGAVLLSGLLALAVAPLALRTRAGGRSPAHASPLVRSALRRPGLRKAIVASLAVTAATDLLVIYLPALGAERAIPASIIGLLLMVRAVAAMASRLALGALASRFGGGRLLVGSMLVSAVGLGLLAVPMPVWLMATVMVAVGAALGLGQPLTMSQVVAAAGPDLRATGLALRLTGNRLAQVGVPAVVGAAAAAGSGLVFAALAVLLTLAAAASS